MMPKNRDVLAAGSVCLAVICVSLCTSEGNSEATHDTSSKRTGIEKRVGWLIDFFPPLTDMLNMLPPPKGAQMTRLMALTQSSMSFWEFAISRKASWLGADRSFSPVPPTDRQRERGSETGKTG